MRLFGYLLVIALSALAGYLGSQWDSDEQANSDTRFERIIQTNTLNCGYYTWPPLLVKDANTGDISGLAYDFTLAVADVTELKINWVGEMNAGTYLQDIAAGRYDAECAEGWPNGVRAKFAYYSKPYAYIPVVAVVREKDTRFTTQNPESLNNPDITMATVDGETSQIITRIRFPKASNLSLPQNVPMADQLMNVVAGKADALLTDALTAHGFMQANPGKVKVISYDPPLHVAALSFTLPQDDRLKNLLDIATDQLIANGTVEELIKKHEPASGLILRVSEVTAQD